jgi:hypothetical protein
MGRRVPNRAHQKVGGYPRRNNEWGDCGVVSSHSAGDGLRRGPEATGKTGRIGKVCQPWRPMIPMTPILPAGKE